MIGRKMTIPFHKKNPFWGCLPPQVRPKRYRKVQADKKIGLAVQFIHLF